MELTAIFESWHVGDGNYPPLHRGQLVRLSFELQPRKLTLIAGGSAPDLQHQGNAEYSGKGLIMRQYKETGEEIAVIAAGDFRFFINGQGSEKLMPGSPVEFEGTLYLDHYIWVEFLERYPDPPDLFRNLRVTRIRKVEIPERFVHRHKGGKSMPAHVPPADFGAVEELETMVGQRFDEEFYVVDFDGTGLENVEIPRTFQ